MKKTKFINQFDFTGTVAESSLEEYTTKSGRDANRASVHIQLGDKTKPNVAKVAISYITPSYVDKKTGKTRTNKVYELISDLEEGNLVHASGSVDGRDFKNQEDELVSIATLSGNHGNFGYSGWDMNPAEDTTVKNKIQLDIAITAITMVDADDEKKKPRYAKISGYIWKYQKDGLNNSTIIPINLIARSAKVLDYFENKEVSKKEPLFTKVNAALETTTNVVVVDNDMDAEDGEVQTRTYSNQSWVITATRKEAYVMGNDYDDNDVNLTYDDWKAYQKQREADLVALEERLKNKAETASQDDDDDDDNLPF